MHVTVYIIEEPGATFVFYDQRDAIRGFWHEREVSGVTNVIFYTGTIPIERATMTADDAPDDEAVEYVIQHCSPPPGVTEVINNWP